MSGYFIYIIYAELVSMRWMNFNFNSNTTRQVSNKM